MRGKGLRGTPIIDLSVIHYTVRPEVSKGVDRLVIGLRYLSPNGRFVANYGMLNNWFRSRDFDNLFTPNIIMAASA